MNKWHALHCTVTPSTHNTLTRKLRGLPISSMKQLLKFCTRRYCSYLSLLTTAVVLILFLYNNYRWPKYVQIERQFYNAGLTARCRVVRRFFGLPSPKISINTSQVVEGMESVCNRTFNVDPLDILRACGHWPLLVSKKQVEKLNLDNKLGYLVPNVVHYVYNYPSADSPMTFLMYLSLLSVHRFIQPRYLFIYGVSLPYGDWWKRTTAEVDNIYFVNLTSKLPSLVYGKKIRRPEHVADILRLEISYAIGGIYFDMDVLAFKSFDGLRNYPFTLARESAGALANGIIICQPCPPFILHWIDNYRTFYPDEWAEHSTLLPHRLAKDEAAHLINVENYTLLSPNFEHLDELYNVGSAFNWTHQHSTHIYKSFGHVPQSPDELNDLNSTIGQMMRYVYTGKRDSINRIIIFTAHWS